MLNRTGIKLLSQHKQRHTGNEDDQCDRDERESNRQIDVIQFRILGNVTTENERMREWDEQGQRERIWDSMVPCESPAIRIRLIVSVHVSACFIRGELYDSNCEKGRQRESTKALKWQEQLAASEWDRVYMCQMECVCVSEWVVSEYERRARFVCIGICEWLMMFKCLCCVCSHTGDESYCCRGIECDSFLFVAAAAAVAVV